ncbi:MULTISPECIES: primosomal protein DnaI [Vagococcus]|uniref:Helicase loader DnaI n=1 Tax=Vagococcus fluvialis bH819 TaxID=1255619 RepID=A0A1X6WNK9_9ENTE|nr:MULTISPECIES: primosomal protein DnaI [Vagococcus]SLM85865.1 Helicase loader DnaI [Vagococcus fluvialis bH819]HCM90286.1 primosomal protein DnaI [Vagococcus sp.]
MENIGKGIDKALKAKNFTGKLDQLMEDVMNDPDVQTFIQDNREKLTDDDIVKSYAKLYEFVQEKKKFELKDATMIAPGYEPRLFMNFHFIDVTYVPTESLIKQKEQAVIRNRVKAMDMPKDIRDARMDYFEIDLERKEAFLEAIKFINNFEDSPKSFHQGLYLQGTFGVGKTYLLGAVANTLAEKGFQTTLVHFPTFAVEMKQSIQKDTVGEKLDMVKKAQVLMIDDIGADSMSSWIRDDILGVILQYRMQEQLPTFFSSNFNMKQLEEEHLRVTQRGEEEPLKAKRIMERVRYLTKEINMIGENRRITE